VIPKIPIHVPDLDDLDELQGPLEPQEFDLPEAQPWCGHGTVVDNPGSGVGIRDLCSNNV